MSEKVFLLGVGAQKCGTTWLHRYLQDHPSVYMSRVKEMHFFDEMFLPDMCGKLAHDYYVGWLSKLVTHVDRSRQVSPETISLGHDLFDRVAMKGSIEAYFDYFSARVGDAKVFGEMTPSYSLLSEEHFQAIKDRYPNTKPIFLMRDPVDRYWSAMRMGARDDGSASALSLVESNLENPQHLLRGRYDLTVQALDAVFGEDAYLAIFSEELYQQSSINRICKYLGIMEREADFQKRENASPENETLDVEARKRIFDAFSPVYRFFDSRGVILPAKWRQSMEQYG